MKNINEVRLFEDIEYRAIENDGIKYIEGYALKFGIESKNLGGFREIIQAGALDNADLSDVVALFNHSPNYVLARKNDKVNTLELKVDAVGLFYRFEVDEEVSYIKDLYINIRKGNISKSSFAFKINEGGDRWEKRDTDYLRTITSFKGIYDVSAVTVPAYDDTYSGIRAFKEYQDTLPDVQGLKVDSMNANKLRLLSI